MANPKGNPQNLMRGNPNTPLKQSDKVSEIARKGGKKSQEVQHRNKNLSELGKAICDSKPNKKIIKQMKEIYPDIPEEEINNKFLMLSQVAKRAKIGDLKAFEILMNIIGENLINNNSNEHKISFENIIFIGDEEL